MSERDEELKRIAENLAAELARTQRVLGDAMEVVNSRQQIETAANLIVLQQLLVTRLTNTLGQPTETKKK